MNTQVAIIGAGPAGSLLAHLLHQAGIESIVIERQSRDYVLSRIRAGVLERGTVDLLRSAGLADRLNREGHEHTVTGIAYGGTELFYFDIGLHASSSFTSYGQTRIQEDLYLAADAADLQFEFEVSDVELLDVATDHPSVTYELDGDHHRIDCRHIVGCDGFYGPSKAAIPDLQTYERTYPFGWLGILSETPPLEHLVYCNSARGFALASQRNPMLSRYYVQCSLDDDVDDWSDDRFWTELLARFPTQVGDDIVTGPSIEKSIAPLRSFVAEPMRYGSLLLAGDAAHIVPPTGAKGLNLAVSDVFYASRALVAHHNDGDDRYLDCYSEMALRRVWASVRFSWWLTTLLHRFPDEGEIHQRLQEAELAYLQSSAHGQAALSEQYAGMPFES